MAAKSPADLKREGEELKTLFAKIKKKQHNCAVLISKDGIVFEAHIKKSPDMMFKAAKAAGGAPKGAWGTITMDGQVLILDPINDKVPGSLTKIAKKFFGERGLKNRLEIKEPEEGTEPTEETAEAEEQPTRSSGGDEAQAEEEEAVQASTAPEESGGQGGPQGDPLQVVKDKYASRQKDIEELNNDKENVMYDGLQEVLKNYAWIIEEGDPEKATEVMRRLEGVLEDYAGLMAEKKPLMKRREDMARDIDKIKGGDNGDAASMMGAAVREYDYALGNNEWVSAGAKLDRMQELISEFGGSEPQVEEEEEEVVQAREETAPTADETPSGETHQEEEEAQTRAASDVGDEGDAGEETGPEADPLQAVKDQFRSLEKEIAELTADTENVMHGSLIDAVRAFDRMLEAGDPGNAADAIRRIEGVLADYDGLMVEKRPLLKRRDDMARGIDSVKNGENSDAANSIGAALRELEYSLSNNEWVSAGLKLDQIEALVEEFGDSAPQVEEGGDTAPETGSQEEDLSEVESNSDQLRRDNMKTQLDGHKKAINAILKNKDSENAQLMTAALLAYSNGLKRDDLDGAQTALAEVDEVLAKADREFTLSDNQRSAIMKELEKMESEIAALTSELTA